MLCETCTHKTCLKRGKPCRKVEKELRKEGIYSAYWSRHKMPNKKREEGQWREIPTSSLNTKGRGQAGMNMDYEAQE